MNKALGLFLTTMALVLFPVATRAADNTWTGTGPYATGLGNRVVTALAVGSDAKTLYAGTGSGTLFSYAATPPTATTGAASGIDTSGATLNGTVNENGADAAVSFEYGSTTAYGTSTTATPATVAAGSGATAVSAVLGGLTAGAVYHYRVTATNSSGTSHGDDASFTLPQINQSITGFAPTATATYGDGAITLSATASSGLAVTFSVASGPGSISGSLLTITGAGTIVVQAAQAGNSSYSAATTLSASIVVSKAAATVALTGLGQTYDGTARSVTAVTTPSGLTVAITYAGGSTVPTSAGSYAVVATVTDGNYSGSAGGTLVIGRATPTITWATPTAIDAGTALSATQLNASANCAGSFAYTPGAGTVMSAGTQTLSTTFTPTDATDYTSQTASVTIVVTGTDTSPPTVGAFTVPAASTDLTVAVTLGATDNFGVTGYLLSESAVQPQLDDAAWTTTAPTGYTFTSQGVKTLYAFARDAVGNVSVPARADVAITMADATPPTVDAFVIPAAAASLTVAVTTLSANDDTGVTAYLLSESSTAAAGDDRWTATVPAGYTFTSQGIKTLYAFAKDAAGNISAPARASVAITLADTTPPTVDTFTVPTTAASLTVTGLSVSAADDTGVAAYLISESGSQPAADDSAWTTTAPVRYVFTSQGSKTLYAFAKDAAGNISVPKSGYVAITLADTTAPTVSAFTLPSTSTSLTVAVSSFTAGDSIGVTGYLISESATASASDSRWTATPTSSYTFGTAGAKTLYAYARDAAGNISASASASVTVTLADTTAPTVSAFTLPSTSTSLTVAIPTLAATDNVAVTGYILTESAVAPEVAASGWTSTAPASHTFSSAGAKTLHAYAKDAAGNISASASASVAITLADTTAPTVSAFTLPAASATPTVAISSFTAGDDTGVTGYLVSESSAVSATDSGWTSTPPASYTFASAGDKTLYAFAGDAAGNVSAPVAANVTVHAVYLVTPSAGTGSSLTPAAAQAVSSGAATSFTVTAAAGYGILSVTGCNGTLSGTTYTTAAVTGACTVTATAVLRNGNGGSGSAPTIADALKTLRGYVGTVQLTDVEKIRYDVAPLSAAGIPQGNGAVDIADVILILRRSIGIGSW